jgi:hypothetical protein
LSEKACIFKTRLPSVVIQSIQWIPAFAGMTMVMIVFCLSSFAFAQDEVTLSKDLLSSLNPAGAPSKDSKSVIFKEKPATKPATQKDFLHEATPLAAVPTEAVSTENILPLPRTPNVPIPPRRPSIMHVPESFILKARAEFANQPGSIPLKEVAEAAPEKPVKQAESDLTLDETQLVQPSPRQILQRVEEITEAIEKRQKAALH